MSVFDSGIPFEKNTRKTSQTLENLLAKNPDDFDANVSYAKILVDESPNKRKARIALECLDRALSQRKDLEAEMLVVSALRLHKDEDEALIRAKKLVRENPNSARLYDELGRIYLAKQELDLAKQWFEKGYEKFRGNMKIQRGLISTLGQMYYSTKDENFLNRAISICDNQLKIKPDNRHIVLQKVQLLVSSHKIHDAKKLLKIFSQEHPEEFFELSFNTNGTYEPFSLSTEFAQLLLLEAEMEIKKLKKLKHRKDVLKFPEIQKYFDDYFEIIDETIRRYPEHDFSEFLSQVLYHRFEFGQYEEALIASEGIQSHNMKNGDLFYKGKTLTALKKFKPAISVFEQILSTEHLPQNQLLVHKSILECLVELKRTDEIKQEKKKIREIKKMIDGKKKENPREQKKNKTTPEQEADNLERLDSRVVDGNSWSSAHDPENGKKLWLDHWRKMKHQISWLDHFVRPAVFNYTDDSIDFDENGIKLIRILSKVSRENDLGKSSYKQYKEHLEMLRRFRENNKNCKIEFRKFFTELTENNAEDLFHRRFLFDNEKAFFVPGNEQAFLRAKHDHYSKCRPSEAVTCRNDYEETWAKGINLENEKFLYEFIKYLIKSTKERNCAEIIEKEHPELVSKIKEELLPKPKEQRTYVTDESKVRSSIKKILNQFPEIADMSSDDARKKFMRETKGKFDPDVVLKILQEISGP